MKSFRYWQRQAREVVQGIRASGGDRALLATAPGTGKTHVGLSLISDDLASQAIDCSVIVVPTRTIKTRWADEFTEWSIKAIDDIDNATLEEHQTRGWTSIDPARPAFIVTYHQVCSAPERFAILCARHKIFAVFDEIHHADDEADYGVALVEGFTDAKFKLSLSGTPVTTKGSRLAFCECELGISDDGKPINVTKPDYSYSYGEALLATGNDDDPYCVRPVEFTRWNGRAKWRYVNIANPEKVEDRIIDGTHEKDSLRPLIDPNGDYLKKMLRAALDELEGYRQHHTNAGMLVTAANTWHCDQITELIKSFGVRDVVTVKYDTPGAKGIIQDFARGQQRVLVAIKMVAEGVDITRLRVGAYCSDIKTWVYFMQFVGRFIRWDRTLSAGQFASVFIPEHVTLVNYALKIEKMVLEAAVHLPGEGEGPGPSQWIVTDKTSDGEMNGAIQHGLDFEVAETETLKAWVQRSGVPFLSVADARKLYQAWNGPQPTPQDARIPEPNESRLNDQLVGQIVAAAKRQGRAEEWTYDRVNAWANRQTGIPKKDKLTPTDTLIRRREHLTKLFLGLLKESVDDAATV